ncbi:hypothetical protein AgCh_018043 [Apium graveolens]
MGSILDKQHILEKRTILDEAVPDSTNPDVLLTSQDNIEAILVQPLTAIPMVYTTQGQTYMSLSCENERKDLAKNKIKERQDPYLEKREVDECHDLVNPCEEALTIKSHEMSGVRSNEITLKEQRDLSSWKFGGHQTQVDGISSSAKDMHNSSIFQLEEVMLQLFIGHKKGVLVFLEASTNQEPNHRIPLFKISPKILCRVCSAKGPDIDNSDEYVRNTTARAFSVVATALGAPALLPFLIAVRQSKKSWQARHTGVRLCSSPYLRSLVEIIIYGLNDEKSKGTTITALSLAVLAEASAPYEYASYYTREVMVMLVREFESNDLEMKIIVLKVVKQCVSTEGVKPDYIRNTLGQRVKSYLPQICGIIKYCLNNKSTKMRQQAADLVSRIAVFMIQCQEEQLMGHLGVVLYESLGEEYPEVLGSLLGALEAIVNVQENCIDLVGRIADRGAEFVPSREWMRICFELLEVFKVQKKGIRRATVKTFGYIAKAIGPQEVLGTLLNNLKVQERQNRVCTTVAIAIV